MVDKIPVTPLIFRLSASRPSDFLSPVSRYALLMAFLSSSIPLRFTSQERCRGASLVGEIGRKPSDTCMVMGDLQMEVFSLKRSGSKEFNWGKDPEHERSYLNLWGWLASPIMLERLGIMPEYLNSEQQGGSHDRGKIGMKNCSSSEQALEMSRHTMSRLLMDVGFDSASGGSVDILAQLVVVKDGTKNNIQQTQMQVQPMQSQMQMQSQTKVVQTYQFRRQMQVEVYKALQVCLEMRNNYVLRESIALWEKEVIYDPSTPERNPKFRNKI
ncbi:hypothetical protein L2E82_19167 [Cichorium intybus]|uniref:Uncharacterized protein n=1 Tax=Cichorium intybus TaxID=13427 RepID=A0ACB9FBE3_CICIN|nr:hypothetical protein L2E82_19167 [Cichorium intybus]